MLLLCEEETSLVKEKFKGLELLLELSISAVEVEMGFLCLESLWMVKFLFLRNVTT